MNTDSILQFFRGYPTWEVLLELAIIWACVYMVFRFLQGTRGAGVIKGFAVVIVLLVLGFQLIGESSSVLGRIKYISNQLLSLLAVLLVVLAALWLCRWWHWSTPLRRRRRDRR